MFRLFKKKKTKLYLIKDRLDKQYNLCPICDGILYHTGNEEHCSRCDFANGMVRLTPKEAKRHKNKILVNH